MGTATVAVDNNMGWLFAGPFGGSVEYGWLVYGTSILASFGVIIFFLIEGLAENE